MMSLLLTSPLFTAESQKKEIKHTELHCTSPFKKIKEFNDHVFLISDSCGNNFVLKQHKDPVKVIREVIASKIGKNIVNINKVQIISHLQGIELNSNMLYTLHEYIIGKCNEENIIHFAICEQKHLEIIAQEDKTLAQIAAFNVYINNFDCHQKNLFRNEETKQFTVIDMDNAFNGQAPVATVALHNYGFLERLKENSLSPKEIIALKVFHETLKKLIDQYPPDKIYNEWKGIIDEINSSYNIQAEDPPMFCLEKNSNVSKEILIELERLGCDSNESKECKRLGSDNNKIYEIHWLYQKIQNVTQAAKNIITAPGDYVFGENASIVKNAFNCTTWILFIYYASYYLNALKSLMAFQ